VLDDVELLGVVLLMLVSLDGVRDVVSEELEVPLVEPVDESEPLDEVELLGVVLLVLDEVSAVDDVLGEVEAVELVWF
jgi:hypothetical protein